jgi:hypothetical protein
VVVGVVGLLARLEDEAATRTDSDAEVKRLGIVVMVDMVGEGARVRGDSFGEVDF